MAGDTPKGEEALLCGLGLEPGRVPVLAISVQFWLWFPGDLGQLIRPFCFRLFAEKLFCLNPEIFGMKII